MDLSFLSLPHTVLPTQNGRVAIVTGGARGMGYETARHLARLGMHVVIGIVHTPFGHDSVISQIILKCSIQHS